MVAISLSPRIKWTHYNDTRFKILLPELLKSLLSDQIAIEPTPKSTYKKLQYLTELSGALILEGISLEFEFLREFLSYSPLIT